MKTKNIIVMLLLLISVACRNTSRETLSVDTIKVKVTGVSKGMISIPVHTSGILASMEELKLSFKTGGIVEKTFFEEGDRVNKGDLLVSLNLSEISANVDQAKNAYDKALRDFKRAENLYRDSVVTLEQKQNAATALNIARSTLDIVQFNLNHSVIVAPGDGIILKQFINAGELVASGYPVLLFGSTGKCWKVKAGISDRDIIKINSGDSAIITFDAYPGESFPAIVDQVGGIANPLTGAYEVEMLLNATTHRLVSGFIAGVDIFPSIRNSFVLIPVESIVEADGNQGYIYIVTEFMTVKKVKIDIETLFDSFAVVKELPEGVTEVVNEGLAYLNNGMKVEVVR